jgi:GNAT superfamily N-acetyltransferase
MPIEILNLNSVPESTKETYLTQIAVWHHSAWGSITGQSKQDFINSVRNQLMAKSADYFIALDTATQKPLGTISLKNRNMEDEYPDHRWGPWLSGLYVCDEARKQGISAMLGTTAIQAAQDRKQPYVFYFTHNHDLASFYHQLQGEQIKPAISGTFSYRNKPILVYRAEPAKLLKLLEAYLSKTGITKTKDQYTTKPAAPSEAQTIASKL